MTPEERRQLGEFLMTRRARLKPEQVGLPPGGRRRTPGLRREEVAQIAGVSVTWYTWIEQGRDIHFSVEVLDSLARSLQLAPHEKDYLFTLAGMQTKAGDGESSQSVSAGLQNILDHQRHYPAYVMGRYWHVLAWNMAAARLFGDFAALPPNERNLLWYVFVRPETRPFVIDWETRARRLLAEFRADSSKHLHDPALDALLSALKAASPEFARWWSQHDVHTRDGGRRDFEHPTAGRLALEQTTFRLSSDPDLKLVIHRPLPEFDTDAKLRTLFAQV